MAWEWLGWTVTGAVGITGSVTTYAAAHSTRAAEERRAVRQRAYAIEDAQRAERKEVCLRLFRLMAAVDARATECALATDKHLAQTAVLNAVEELRQILLEVSSLCSESVAAAASGVVDAAQDVQDAMIDDPLVPMLIAADSSVKLADAVREELAISPPV